MVRLRKEDTADLDIDELDAIEYSTETFDSYDGEVPPKDIELVGYVKKMWWTRSQGNDPMLKILWVAADNDGENDEYNDCPFWLNYALIGGAKFRWAPFLETYGITLKQIKSNTDVEDKDDQNGAPIIKIGNWHPGEANDEAWCRIVTGSERWNGEYKPAVATWLPYEADDEADDVEDEEPEEDEEEEPEEEPEPEPARGRGGRGTRSPARSSSVPAGKPAAGRGTRSAAKTPEKAAPARTERGARGARTAAKPAAEPARGRGRGRAQGSNDDPPF